MTTRYIRESALRTYYILLSTTITLLSSYYFSEQTIYILTTPLDQAHGHAPPLWTSASPTALNQQKWIFTELTEAFYTYILISAALAAFFLFPTIIYQTWQFTKPGLYLYERFAVLRIIALSSCLSLMNLAITYFFILPSACKFFLSFEIASPSIQLHLEAKIYTYICLILRWLFLCHFIFQLPVLISALEAPRLRKFVYPFLALLGAFAPDIVSQILILFITFSLYESSVFIVKFAKYVRRCTRC